MLFNRKYSLCMYLQRETIDVEFKEFYLRSIRKYFEEEDIKCIYESSYIINKKTFNNMILEDIRDYIINYLPKYICNYTASNINGYLHIGISDEGIVTGIPYFGNLSYKFINRYINICFKEYLRSRDTGNKTIHNYYKNNIIPIISKIRIDKTLLDDHYKIRLEQLKVNQKKSVEEYNKYVNDYKEWYSQKEKYSIKLHILLNDMEIRQEILKFIVEYTEKNEFDISMYYESLMFYNSTVIIKENITVDIIKKYENDYNNYLTWLILFKDSKIEDIKKNKPINMNYRKYDLSYSLFARQMNNITPYLLSNNCNFYLITFLIKNKNSLQLEYKDINDKWLYKKRVVDKNGFVYCT